MKAMILLVVVLMASVASAREIQLLDSPMPSVNQTYCFDDTLLRFNPCTPSAKPPTSCETQMREALEAVGPYLSWRQSSHVTAEYCNERCSINRQIEALDRREKVQAQYNAALKCGK